jgi:hypothetical protein
LSGFVLSLECVIWRAFGGLPFGEKGSALLDIGRDSWEKNRKETGKSTGTRQKTLVVGEQKRSCNIFLVLYSQSDNGQDKMTQNPK